MENIRHVQAGDWPALMKERRPVFVDFWAEWCAPCRMLAPTFEKLAEKYSQDFVFAKVDVDALPDLASQLGIRSIPTLILFKGGQEAEHLVGARPLDELSRLLEAHLAPASGQ